MDVRFVAPDWENLDALRSEAILTPFFSDERPLAGTERFCIGRFSEEGQLQ